MCHTKNSKKRLFDRTDPHSTRTQSARAPNLTPDSDSPCPKTPGYPKIITKKPPNKNYQNRFDRAATPEARGTRTQSAHAQNPTPDSNSALNSTPETCVTLKTSKNPFLTA